mmetsp:Transcript_13496/g.26551  ORF Transcript_13496/g.26551 Transcript_13496/m.26551 type:complete len:80 (+) Transcript_13496:70-309(+)
MFMFHRLLSLVTMMYNEEDELTLCDFVRSKDVRRMQQARRERERVEEESQEVDEQGVADVKVERPTGVTLNQNISQPSS